MSQILPLDHERACPKCNTDGATFRYCPGDPRSAGLTLESVAQLRRVGIVHDLCVGVTTEEHQHRKCRLCSFEWLEHVYVPPPAPPRRRRRQPDAEEE